MKTGCISFSVFIEKYLADKIYMQAKKEKKMLLQKAYICVILNE